MFDQNAQKDPAYQALRAAVAELIDTTWGAGKSGDRRLCRGALRLPFRATQEKQYKGYDIPGGKFISPWTKNRPGVIDAHRNEILTPEDVYAGMRVRATVSARSSYATSGNKGISFALNNIQICGGGERLDGRAAAKDEFNDYDEPGALVTVDDEAPF